MKTLPRKTWMVTGALGALALTGAVVAGGAAADSPTPSPTSLIDTVPVPTDTGVPAGVVVRSSSAIGGSSTGVTRMTTSWSRHTVRVALHVV